MGEWEIRRASLRDREGLVELCIAAAGEDDYVLRMLDDVVLHGVYQIALDGDRIVGATHYTDAIDGSVWLSAARTHPDYQRRRVASELIESLVELARRSRREALRLWSSASNTAGVAAANACGFQEVARFTRVLADATRARGKPESLTYSSKLAAEVKRSRILRLANGYVPYLSYFVKLTPANAHLLASARALWRTAGGILCLSSDDAKALAFGLVAGTPSKVLPVLPRLAPAFGARTAAGFLPQNRNLLKAAEEAGFRAGTWGADAILFERPVAVVGAAYRRRPTYAELAAGKREGYAALGRPVGQHGHGRSGPHEDRWNP